MRISGFEAGMRKYLIIAAWILASVAAIQFVAPQAHASQPDQSPAPAADERWYVMRFDGQKAGWMRAWSETAGEGDESRITTKSRMEFDLRRGKAVVSLKLESEFIETARGEPVSMASVQQLGPKPVTTVYRFTKEGIESRVQGSDRLTRHSKPEGAWLPPAAAAEYVRQRMEAGAKEIVVRSMDAATGPIAFTATRKILGEESIEVFGKSVPAFRCEMSVDTPPVKSIEYVDAQGEMLRTTMDLGGMKFELVAADRETAQISGEAPEIMIRTFVRGDKSIKAPRETREASFVLRLPRGKELPSLPDIGAQDVERIDDGSWRVRVDMRHNDAATTQEAGDPRYLAATAMCDASDARIVDLAEKGRGARGQDNSPETRARRLQRVVFEHVRKKSLGVGFASASDVVRTREGDCSEHAVLLAAALRADKIPSRVVSGLVYVEEILGEKDVFGYHMWTEALVPGPEENQSVWLTLDATMGPMRPDATHIALATSALEDGTAMNSLIALAPMFGALQIEVESIE